MVWHNPDCKWLMTENLKVTGTEAQTLNKAVRTDVTLQSNKESGPNRCEQRSKTYKGKMK